MKKTVLFTAFLLTVFSAAAYVGYSGPQDQPHALGAPSEQPVKENGTGWNMSFIDGSASSSNKSTGVQNHSFGENTLNISGTVQTPQPCYSLDAEVEESGDNTYNLSVTSEREGDENGTVCADVISYIDYNSTFQADEPFKLNVRHDDETVETLEHPEYVKPAGGDGSTGGSSFTAFFDWFRSFF